MKRIAILSFLACMFSCQELELETTHDTVVEVTASSGGGSAMPVFASGYDPGYTWTMNFQDEFNSGSLNTSDWTVENSTKSRSVKNRDSELKGWYWKPERVSVNNGKLVLESYKVNEKRLDCGAIQSNNKYETKFGYFEARIKIADPAEGSHTAFWLQGDTQANPNQAINGTGADGAEIDIFESVYTNEKTKSVVHIDGYQSGLKAASTKQYNTPGMNDNQYHTYGLLWEPGQLKIYYDGVHKTTYTGAFVPLVNEFLFLSIGAAFDVSNPNSGADGFSERAIGSSIYSYVDYVRVWKYGSNENPYYRMQNRETWKWFKTYGTADNSQIKQTSTSSTGAHAQWRIKATDDGFFQLVNKETGKYIRPVNSNDNSIIELRPTSDNSNYTQWRFVHDKNHIVSNQDMHFFLRNRATGKCIRPSSFSNTAALQQKPASVTSRWTRWRPVEF